VRAVLFRPAGNGPFPALVVVHGDHGLNDAVKAQARRLAGKGYLTLAIDLYRGEVPANLMDAHILDRGLPEERAGADLKAAADYLTGRPDVRREALGIFGCDMGGDYALEGARADPRLRAAVVCYGRLITDSARLAPMRAAVLGIFAGKDVGIGPETIAEFRSAMQRAGKRLAGTHVYPGCSPGFLDADSTAGKEPAAARAREDAWGKIDAFLNAELKRGGEKQEQDGRRITPAR
jgi:carboxymethylenebutenolidase